MIIEKNRKREKEREQGRMNTREYKDIYRGGDKLGIGISNWVYLVRWIAFFKVQ